MSLDVVETGRSGDFLQANITLDLEKNKDLVEVKMIRKTVSVLIPAFNAQDFILDALDSVRKQSFKPFEVLVLDDASSDNTRQVVRAYKRKYRTVFNLKLFSSSVNLGIGGARSELVKLAKGNFIAFLSSDDVWDSDFLDTVMLEVTPYRGVYCDYWLCDSKLRMLAKYESQRFSKENVVLFALNKNMFVNFSCCVFPKAFFNKIGFDCRLRHGEDLVLLLDLVLAGLELKYVDVPLLFYRLHENQGTHINDKKEFYNVYGLVANRLMKLGVGLEKIREHYVHVYLREFPTLFYRVKRKIRNVIKKYLPLLFSRVELTGVLDL